MLKNSHPQAVKDLKCLYFTHTIPRRAIISYLRLQDRAVLADFRYLPFSNGFFTLTSSFEAQISCMEDSCIFPIGVVAQLVNKTFRRCEVRLCRGLHGLKQLGRYALKREEVEPIVRLEPSEHCLHSAQ